MSRLDPARGALAVALLGGAAALLYIGQVAAFHCDETNVWRHAARFAEGDFHAPGRPGLLWLALAPLLWLDDPVLVARGFRVVAALASILALVGVASLSARDDGRDGGERAWTAALAIALLVTCGGWLKYAFEVRTDTFVVALTLAAMAQLWRPDPGLRRAAIAGGFVAAAGLVSQKSVYNAAAIGAGWAVYVLATQGWRDLRPRLREGAVAAGVTATAMAAWFGLLALVSDRGGAAVTHTFEVAKRTGFGTDITLEDKLENLSMVFESGPAVWVIAALAVPWLLVTARRRPLVAASLTAALVLVATIQVHRGFRPYYIASMIPYLAIPAGALLAATGAALARRAPPAVAVVLVAAAVGGSIYASREVPGPLVATNNRHQIRVMEDIREAFPEPVPYWDMIGLVPGYPEMAFLGTGPQRRIFRKRATDRHRAFMERARERRPRFFIADYMSRTKYLTKTERRWHWRHFLPYRDNLYLHGGRMLVRDEARSQQVELLVDGEYTVWLRGGWEGEASVDGRAVEHREVLTLEAGPHTLRGAGGDGELWVILGAGVEPTADDVRDQVDWSMYPHDPRDRFQHYDRKRNLCDLRTPLWDPTMTDRKARGRERRHRKFQAQQNERVGTP